LLSPNPIPKSEAASKDFGTVFGLSKDRPGEFGHTGPTKGFQALLVMNSDTGQGVAIMADSDNGILVADEYLRSLAREYHWKYQPSRDPQGCKWRCCRVKGLERVAK